MSTSAKAIKIMDLSEAPIKTKAIITNEVIIIDRSIPCDEAIALIEQLDHDNVSEKYKIVEYEAFQFVRV